MLKRSAILLAMLFPVLAAAEAGAPDGGARLVQELMNRESPPEYLRFLRLTNGSALFLKHLCAIGGLPGVARGAHGRSDTKDAHIDIDSPYPMQLRFVFQETGNVEHGYVYEVTKASEERPFHLARALRKEVGSEVEEVLLLPTAEQESAANARVEEEMKGWEKPELAGKPTAGTPAESP